MYNVQRPVKGFLATVHCHFSGFTLQILIAATGLQLPGPKSGAT
jgi:hypothetical protein